MSGTLEGILKSFASILCSILDLFLLLLHNTITTITMIIIIMISNNVPTTAPLITATLTESSSLSLDGISVDSE